MELKKISKVIHLTKKLIKINTEILEMFPEKTFEHGYFVSGGYDSTLSNYQSLLNNLNPTIRYLEKWRYYLIEDKKQKLKDGDLKDIRHLIELKVPKAEICRKFNISYPTLQKYLASETIVSKETEPDLFLTD